MMEEHFILELVKKANPDNPLQFVRNIVKDYSIEKLNNQILNCKDCEICGNKTIFHGDSNASIMIIGSSPTCFESNINKALYDDKDNDILDQTLAMLKANKKQLFFANVVNCIPYKTLGGEKVQRIATINEAKSCSLFINHAIEIVQPLVIVTMGAIAYSHFNNNSGSLLQNRGNWFSIKGIPAIATYEPSYFIQMEGIKDEELLIQQQYEFIDDITKAFNYIKENHPNLNLY